MYLGRTLPGVSTGGRGYVRGMSKAVLALFVLAVVAIGIVVVLLVGSRTVEEDGVEKDGALPAMSGARMR